MRFVNHIPVLIAFATFIATVIRHQLIGHHDHDKCHAVLYHGRWQTRSKSSDNVSSWHPFACKPHIYTSGDIRACLHSHNIKFRGDSTARQIFWAVARLLDNKRAEQEMANADRHADVHLKLDGTVIGFSWDPFLNRSLDEHPAATILPSSTTILGGGLWHARHLTESLHCYEASINRTLADIQGHSDTGRASIPLIALPVSVSQFRSLSKENQDTITPMRLEELNNLLEHNERPDLFEVLWSSIQMASGADSIYMEDGIHVTARVANIQANLILNRVCNPIFFSNGHKVDSSCCVQYHLSRGQTITVITFTLILINCAAMPLISYIRSAVQSVGPRPCCSSLPHPATADTEAGAYCYSSSRLIKSIAIIAAAILYSFCADRSDFFLKTTKPSNPSLYGVLALVIVAMSFLTVYSISSAMVKPGIVVTQTSVLKVLARQQTEEWKGWMQLLILLYHFFGLSTNLLIYRIIRVLVASYLFLTGYGHAMFIFSGRKMGLRRVTSVLLRLNMLSIGLSWCMNTRWDFYYFPALVSTWLIILWATLGLRSPKTITITENVATAGMTMVEICIRVALSAFFMTFIVIEKSLIEKVLDIVKLLKIAQVDSKEFIFRLSLDIYAPYWGVLFAAAQHFGIIERLMMKLGVDQRNSSRMALILVSILILLSYFGVNQILFDSKEASNRYHTFFSVLPLLAYIALRNSTKYLRSCYISMFEWLGRCSLETFVMQYHTWLAVDTKGLLHLGIIDRPEMVTGDTVVLSVSSWRYWLEKLVITIIFVWVCGHLSKATIVLVDTVMKTGSRGRGSGS